MYSPCYRGGQLATAEERTPEGMRSIARKSVMTTKKEA